MHYLHLPVLAKVLQRNYVSSPYSDHSYEPTNIPFMANQTQSQAAASLQQPGSPTSKAANHVAKSWPILEATSVTLPVL